jgi:hypothetical protein
VREALKRDLEAARYATDRAFRQYDAADPVNRLVAGELETRWNRALARVAEVEGKIAAHDAANPAPVADPGSLATLAADLKTVWTDPSTDARLKKRIVRTVIHEVVADIDAEAAEIAQIYGADLPDVKLSLDSLALMGVDAVFLHQGYGGKNRGPSCGLGRGGSSDDAGGAGVSASRRCARIIVLPSTSLPTTESNRG